jgi:hypothetical protein
MKAAESDARFTMALQMTPPEGEQEATAELLRIGIVLDSYNVSAWVARVIDDLITSDFLNVAGIALLPVENAARNGRTLHWFFRKYAAWDAARKRSEDDPLRVVDVSGPVKRVTGGRPTEPNGIDALAGCDLDALIWMASREPPTGLKQVARYGVWLYRWREPAHFWEIYDRNPVTRSALEILREEADAPEVVYEAYSATAQGWSWQENRTVPYWRASTFVLRSLRRLHTKKDPGPNGMLQGVEKLVQGNGPAAVAEGPTSLQLAGFLLRNAVRTVNRRLRYSGKESHWFVAYRGERGKFVSNTEKLDLQGFKPIRAPEGHFYADPFVIKWQGQNYLFLEDYLFGQRRGCISVMEIGRDGTTSEAERVLDKPYHLSYPFVFEHQGGLYMIPETLGAGRIELYRAADVPTRWEFVKVLRENVQAVDTTMWVENGQFFFFTNIAERGATVNDELYLFCADDLLGEWKPHPGNPIVTDVRRSRGAGKLFRRNGRLIRPAQDCSVRYGYACQLNEIEILTRTEYRERPVQRIQPDWAPGLIGTHTVNSNDELEVIDGQIYGKRYAAGHESGER